MIGALALAIIIAAPEVRIVAPEPATLAPKLEPWLLLVGDVLPGLHPRSLRRVFEPAGFDPWVPSTWPKALGARGVVLSGTPEALLALGGEVGVEAWRAQVTTSAEKRPGDLWIRGRGIEGLGAFEGPINVGASTVGYDLRVTPEDHRQAQAWIGPRGSRPLIEVQGVIGELSGTFAPSAFLEAFGVSEGFVGPVQVLLLEDGALLVAAEIDPAKLASIRLPDREQRVLGRILVWAWPGIAGPHLDEVRPAPAEKRPGLYAVVTPAALLASLAGRGQSRVGPRLAGSELMAAQFAVGRALAGLGRIQIEIDRRKGGLGVRGRLDRVAQKP